MKFCKDCKWCCADGGFFWRSVTPNAKCGYVKNNRNVMVTGDIRDSRDFCSINRGCEHLCGPDAKWFEPKEA